MKLTRRKKWYFIFGVFFCSILLLTSSVSAVSQLFVRYYGFQIRGSKTQTGCTTPVFDENQYYFAPKSQSDYDYGVNSGGLFCNIQNFIVETTDVQNLGGNYFSTTGMVNLVVYLGDYRFSPPFAPPPSNGFNTDGIDILAVSFLAGGQAVTTTTTKLDVHDTLWYRDSYWLNGYEYRRYYETLTIYYSATGHGAGNGSGHFRILLGFPTDSGKWFLKNPTNNRIWYFEPVDQSPTVSFGTALDVVMLGQLTGNSQTQLNIEDMDRTNIQNAHSQSISSSENANTEATTLAQAIIGNLYSFISALYSVQFSHTCYIEPMTFRGYTITQRMDLCSLPVPSSLSAIGTLGFIFILVPFGVHVVRRMLALYEELVR